MSESISHILAIIKVTIVVVTCAVTTAPNKPSCQCTRDYNDQVMPLQELFQTPQSFIVALEGDNSLWNLSIIFGSSQRCFFTVRYHHNLL